MQQYKYNFYQLVQQYGDSRPYPDDVNNIFEDRVRRFESPELDKLLVEIRSTSPKPFGHIWVIDANMVRVCDLQFERGIVCECEINQIRDGHYKPVKPFRVIYNRKFRSKAVTFKRSEMPERRNAYGVRRQETQTKTPLSTNESNFQKEKEV
jgi:hypothetical protein